MARHKNVNWNLKEKPGRSPDGGETYSVDTIKMSVLLDIRDELQTLNRVMSCPELRSIPGLLRRIARNTAKKKRR